MTKYLFLSFCFIALSSCAQKNYMAQSVAFIREIKQNELADSNFILVDKPYAFEYSTCPENFLTDSSFYTKEELALIQKTIKNFSFRWNNELLPEVKIVSSDTVSMIFKDRSKNWRYFNKHIGRGFYTFSMPIFFRNETYCLFYSVYNCGNLCGEGHLILYRKENNKWVALKTYCNWIS